jgi:hypothetical protein
MSTAQDLQTAAIYDNRLDDVAWAVVGICNRSLYAGGVVRATERYHGIKA